MNILHLTLVFVTAVISSLNPYSLGLFILIFAYILGSSRNTRRYLLIFSYILSFFILNLLISFIFIYFSSKISEDYYGLICWLVAVLSASFGLMQIKQYFFANPKIGLNFTSNVTKKVKTTLNKSSSLVAVMSIGVISALIAMPFTLISFMAMALSFNLDSVSTYYKITLFYNLIYIIPLIYITLKVLNKTKISQIKNWLQKNKQIMRLTYGIISVSLSWILFLSIKGTIDLG